MADGTIGEKERDILSRLREQLELSPHAADGLERRVLAG